MDARSAELTRLVGIVDRLRDDCPWDREQTLATMAPCAQEEAAEVADAVASGATEAIGEELGDLLMNVFLMARIGEQERRFSLADVARRIGDKLIHRHPHVFGDVQAGTAKQALASWDRIKEQEKAQKRERDPAAAPASVLDEVPERLSALGRAMKLGKKAAKVGFDWPDADGALAKVEEELREIGEARAQAAAQPAEPRDEAGRKERLQHELGDLLFAVVNVARKLDLDAEQALREANVRFERRFRHVEQSLGPRIKEAGLAEMERHWQQAKAAGL